MALSPLHHEFPCKDHAFHHGTSRRQGRGQVLSDTNSFSSARTFPCPAFDLLMKAAVTSSSTTALGRDYRLKKSYIRSIPYCLSSRGKLCLVRASPETKIIKEKLELLDSYFGKLEADDEKKPSISTGDEKAKLNSETELESLSVYLDKQQKDAVLKPEGGSAASKLTKADIKSNNNNNNNNNNNSPFNQLDDDDEDQGEDTLNFYTVSILAAINVGVCLFEAAAPVRNNEMGLLSLPLLYGAKINDLIVAGEWWRLVTPMFLHSGVPHVALSSWALLTFGPKVCRGYGIFTFCLIYILGGVSGNFMSFLHTPDPTVGGTGPAFALIGAWLVDQSQNKEMIKRDEYEDLFQKAIVMTGLGLILSHFGPIDDWTNLGALVAGIVYGFFTCPVLQLGRGSERPDGIVSVGREKQNSGDPCKSFLVFVVFVALLVTCVLVLGDGPLDFPTYDDVVYSLI